MKYPLHSDVTIRPEPGFWGRVIMVDLYPDGGGPPRYLVDCHPGACGGYRYYAHPDGYGNGKTVAANWFDEEDLSPHDPATLPAVEIDPGVLRKIEDAYGVKFDGRAGGGETWPTQLTTAATPSGKSSD